MVGADWLAIVGTSHHESLPRARTLRGLEGATMTYSLLFAAWLPLCFSASAETDVLCFGGRGLPSA